MDERMPDLRETLTALWRRKALVVFVTVAVAALSVLVSASRPRLYTAGSRVVLHPVVSSAGFSSLGSGSKSGPLGVDVAPDTQVEIATSPAVAERVLERPEFSGSPIPSYSINARLITDDLLEIVVSSGSAAKTAQLANAYAEEFLGYRKSVAVSAITSLAADLKNRLDSTQRRANDLNAQIIKLSAQAASIAPNQTNVSAAQAGARAQRIAAIAQLTSERDALVTQLASLRTRYEEISSAQSVGSGGEVLSKASVPTSPSSPKPVRAGVIGLFLGLIFGAGLGLLLHYFDDRVRTAGDVLRAGGISVVGGIPRVRRWHRRTEPYLVTVADPQSAPAEAYRSLRESLLGMGLGHRVRSILITSGGAQAGTSSTAANLAVVSAQAGLRVVIVSADMRSPRVHEFFGIPNDRGLVDVLQGGRSVRPYVQATSIPNVYVLPAGAAPQNPAELLDRKHIDAALQELLTISDVVILDAPSLASGADAVVMSRSCDLALLSMRHLVATTSGVASSVSALRQAGAKDIYGVLTVVDGSTSIQPLAEEWEMPPAATNGNGGRTSAARLDLETTVADVRVTAPLAGEQRTIVAERRPRRARRTTATPPADENDTVE